MGVDATSRADLPAKIGRYAVLGYLADGGMAEIFLGRDAGHPVVIKRILPHLARQQNFVSMFIDEARIGSLVHHPNVVETRELGQVGNDLFMVMEYLAGESVSGLLRRLHARGRRLPVALGAYIVAEACAGLHAAHELADEDGQTFGLVHRDVSPSNLFITYDGEVKVLDFGVATAAHRLTRTATGQVKGKFSYMSPEQCVGEALDRRTDIFALGVVLYELTTQHRLFKRANELMVLKAVTAEPVPLPTRKIADYPVSLERIVLRALERDRDRRQSTASELRNELLALMTSLGFQEDPRRALSELMQDLFPERITEKRDLLRHVRAGTELPMIPAAEVDENVEMPQVAASPTASVVAESSQVGRVQSSRGWLIALVAVLVTSGGFGGWWWYEHQKQQQLEQKDEPPPVAAPIVEPSMIDAAPVIEVDASTQLTIQIESIPTGAALSIDGKRVGATPFELMIDAPRKLTLELALDGHTPVRQELDLDHSQRLLIPMPALPTKPARKKPRKQDDPFKRFD